MHFTSIRVASDLHLEGFSGRDPESLAAEFLPPDPQDESSILVLAGDISSKPEQLMAFIATVLPRFIHIIFVPGNHELYRHDYGQWNKDIDAQFRVRFPEKVSWCFGEVGSINFHGIQFVFGTLWGDGGKDLYDRAQVSRGLNDFFVIKNGIEAGNHYQFKKFSVMDMIEINKRHKRDIEDCLRNFNGKSVVITHHLPSRRLVSERFWPHDGSDGINGGFACDCDNIIATCEPALWIHGHTHDAIDTKLWNTRIVCNPTGYRTEWNNGYSGEKAKFIEIGSI